MAGRAIGQGEAWAIVTALSYTTVNVLLRAAAVEVDAWVGSLLRQAPVAALAWSAVLVSDRGSVTPADRRFLGWRLLAGLAAAGFVSFVVGNVLFFGSLASAGLGVAAAGAQGGVVLAGALLGTVLLAERQSRVAAVGIGVIVAGLAAIALARGTPGAAWLIGLALAVGAGTSYAAANLVTRIVQRARAALFVTLAAQSVGGFGVLLVIALARGGADPLLGTDGDVILIVLAAGVINALALIGIVQSLRHLPLAASSSIQSATIVFSFLAAVVIFGEAAPPFLVAGVGGVAAGIVIAQLGRTAQTAPEPVTPPEGRAAS
jgi:drug/metabolite transporter (DMT)-like permease